MLDSLNIEMSIDSTQKNNEAYWERFKNRIHEFEGNTDVIIIDSAPSITPLNLSALFAADILITPTTASRADITTFHQYISLMENAFTNMVESRLITKDRLPNFIPRILISNHDEPILSDRIKPKKDKHSPNPKTNSKFLANEDGNITTILLKTLDRQIIKKPIVSSDAIKESSNNRIPVFEIDTTQKVIDGKKKFTITNKTLKKCEDSYISFGYEIKQIINSLNNRG
jgi:cellulose biosynthesis protein BcsQ